MRRVLWKWTATTPQTNPTQSPLSAWPDCAPGVCRPMMVRSPETSIAFPETHPIFAPRSKLTLSDRLVCSTHVPDTCGTPPSWPPQTLPATGLTAAARQAARPLQARRAARPLRVARRPPNAPRAPGLGLSGGAGANHGEAANRWLNTPAHTTPGCSTTPQRRSDPLSPLPIRSNAWETLYEARVVGGWFSRLRVSFHCLRRTPTAPGPLTCPSEIAAA